MAYYNRNYGIFNLQRNSMKYLNSGECAKILYNGDIVFKEYFPKTGIKGRLNSEMFDILKTINSPYFIQLFDVYCNFDLIELFKYKMQKIPFVTDAYTCRYYHDDSVNVLYINKDYILDNFNELEILFGVFTDNLICTEDVKRENAVLSNERIIIIDPDYFYKSTSSIDTISQENKKNLLKLFQNICRVGAIKQPYYNKLVKWLYTEFNDIEVTASTNITYEISKKLKYVKKPIDIFIK